MLLPAITRARCAGAERCCTSAYSGTMKKPPHAPIITRSNTTRHTSARENSAASSWPGAKAPAAGLAHHRSSANRLSPIAPGSTMRGSTRPRDRRPHSSEPAPMPIENSASSNVTARSSPPR